MKKPFIFIFFISAFFVSKVDAQFTNLLSFNIATGTGPLGSLISDGTFLYGMTEGGGTYGQGSIFKIMPNGSGFSNLFDFTATVYDTIGSTPSGSLFYDGTFLYGMTRYGGINELGTIFKIMPDGSGYQDLLDFAGTSNGNSPRGSLISDGTFLYGMTPYGGAYDEGTVFKIMPDGSGYDKLLDFSGSIGPDGGNPYGSLIYDGSFLYGVTPSDGLYNGGTIFKIMPDGTGYTSIFDFDGVTDGYAAQGSLVSDGTFLYGMARLGGANNRGTLFKIMPDGSGYSTLIDFSGASNGSDPHGSLIYDGTFLYGMTIGGGTSDSGTVFKIMPDGSGYVKLLDFTGANGSYPVGDLVSGGTFLSGMTSMGGANGLGTIFKICFPPNITANTTADTTCIGTNVTLTGSGGDVYNWTGGVVDGVGFAPPMGTTTYIVTGTDSATGCVNTDSISISAITCSDIYGHVSYTGGDVTNGSVIIYPYDSVYASFDTLQVQSLDTAGNYHFPNVLPGDYLIKVFNDTIAYPTLTSTYYDTQWLWDSAQVLTHGSIVNDTADIVMIELNLGGGMGLFHGQIIEGYGWGRSPGDPIEGIDVKLNITGTNQLVACTVTDVNGNYTFSNMPFGNYTVYIDIPGLERDSSHVFTADSTDNQFLCLDYLVDSVAIHRLPCTLGINETTNDQTLFNIYPNPIRENGTLRYSISSNANVKLDIFNIWGVKIQSLLNTQQQPGEYSFDLNPSNYDLKPGVYLISLVVNGKTNTKKVVVLE